MADLVVRRLADDSEVHRVALRSNEPRYVERVMSGLLTNMGEDFYVDDSEIEHPA